MWIAAVQLLALGISTGILLARLSAVESKVETMQKDYVTRSELIILRDSANREHDRMWLALGKKTNGQP